MTMIHITDKQTDKIIGFISEDDFWNNERNRSLQDNVDTFDFDTFADEPYSSKLEDMNRLLIEDKTTGGYAEFIIDESVTLMDDTGFHYKSVFANGSFLELRKQKLLPPQTTLAMSPEGHVNHALAGTDWQAGNIDYAENHVTNLTAHMDAYAYLRLIAQWSGLELRFRIEHNGTRVTGRYVDLIDRKGQWRGFEAVFGANLLEIERRRKYGEVVTALLGLGPANDDGKPRMEYYLEDDDALQRWGRFGKHLIEKFEVETEDQAMSMDTLQKRTQEELRRRISHQTEYVATIATLTELLGTDPMSLQFGDVIRVKDEAFNPPLYLEARVHSMKEDVKDYGESEVTLGDFTEFTEEEVKEILKRLQSQIDRKIDNATLVEAVINLAEPKRITQPTPPSDTSVIWVDNSSKPYVPKVYAGAVDGWVKMAHTTAAEVGADPAGTAATELQKARGEITQVNNELVAFKNQYDTFVSDGFVSQAEALSIERHIAALTAEKRGIDNDYTVVYANAALTGTPKTNLNTQKTAYNTAHTNLINAINTAIADGYVTATEKTAVNTAFTNYTTALGNYTTARTNAATALSGKQAADAQAAAITAAASDATTKATNAQTAAINAANAKAEAEREIAKAYADGIVDAEEQARIEQATATLQAAQNDAATKANDALTAAKAHADLVRSDLANEVAEVELALSDFQTNVNGAFQDGIIEKAEATAIEKYKNSLEAEKLDLDNRYTRIYADTALIGTPKTNLASAKTAYNTAHSNLITSINTAITDGKATVAERTDVNSKFTAYRTALGTLVTRLEEAVTSTVNKKAADAQAAAIAAAATDAQTKATAAQTAAQSFATTKAEAEREVAKAYADGKLTTEEQNRVNAINAALVTAAADAKTKADAAAAAAQAYSDAQTTGARNLLRNSTFNSGLPLVSSLLTLLPAEPDKPMSAIAQVSYTGTTAQANPIYFPDRIYLEPKVGDTLTFSFDFFCEDVAALGPTGAVMSFRRFDTATGGSATSIISPSTAQMVGTPVSGKWIRLTYTYAFTASTAIPAWFAFAMYASSTTASPNIRYKFREIQVEKGNKASDWSPSPEDIQAEAQRLAAAAEAAAKSYADAMKVQLTTDIGTVNTALSNFQTNVNGAFKDGVIEEAEAKAIEKYKNSLTAEKLDLDNRFTRIYADTALLGTPKTNLNTAKTSYNTAHTNLITSINAAILDNKATVAEKADVDAKFTLYRTALGTLSTRFEEAIAAITTKRAGDAQSAAELAAAVDADNKANAAQTAAEEYAAAVAAQAQLNAEAFADGVVSEEEKARLNEAAEIVRQTKLYADKAAKDAVNAIDNSGLATKTELEAEAQKLRDQLAKRAGSNVVRNSLGYAGLDFWQFTTASMAVRTVMNQDLASLGFGCGFYFPADGVGKGIRQTVTVTEGEEHTLSWYLEKSSAGSFTIEVLQGTTVIATAPDITPVNAGFGGSFLTFKPTDSTVTIRFTASGALDATLTGVMLGLGNLPSQWTLANGELYNAVVRADERGLIVMRLDENGDVEGYTNMSPSEFAGYYDENRDGNFERVFWLNQDETVTKKLRALEEITMGTLKIIRIQSAQNRGWVIVPIVPE